MIDDQVETYTADILGQMKANHEKWVVEKLSDENKKEKPFRIRQEEENLPEVLFRIWVMVLTMMAFSMNMI